MGPLAQLAHPATLNPDFSSPSCLHASMPSCLHENPHFPANSPRRRRIPHGQRPGRPFSLGSEEMFFGNRITPHPRYRCSLDIRHAPFVVHSAIGTRRSVVGNRHFSGLSGSNRGHLRVVSGSVCMGSKNTKFRLGHHFRRQHLAKILFRRLFRSPNPAPGCRTPL